MATLDCIRSRAAGVKLEVGICKGMFKTTPPGLDAVPIDVEN